MSYGSDNHTLATPRPCALCAKATTRLIQLRIGVGPSQIASGLLCRSCARRWLSELNNVTDEAPRKG